MLPAGLETHAALCATGNEVKCQGCQSREFLHGSNGGCEPRKVDLHAALRHLTALEPQSMPIFRPVRPTQSCAVSNIAGSTAVDWSAAE